MKGKRNLPQNLLPLPSHLIDKLLNSPNSAPLFNNLFKLCGEIINQEKELAITKEIETTKRMYIEFLREKTLKELDMLKDTIDKLVGARIEFTKHLIDKQLNIMENAIRDGDVEMLKIILSGLIKTIGIPLLSEEELSALDKALNGDSNVEIEI